MKQVPRNGLKVCRNIGYGICPLFNYTYQLWPVQIDKRTDIACWILGGQNCLFVIAISTQSRLIFFRHNHKFPLVSLFASHALGNNSIILSSLFKFLSNLTSISLNVPAKWGTELEYSQTWAESCEYEKHPNSTILGPQAYLLYFSEFILHIEVWNFNTAQNSVDVPLE